MCGICGEMRFDGDKPNQSKMLNMMDSIAKEVQIMEMSTNMIIFI